LVDRLQESLHQAAVKLEEFERFVARQADRWKVARAAGELATALKDGSSGDATDQFLKEEAVNSIRDALNLSFARIDQILRKEEVRRIVAGEPSRRRLRQRDNEGGKP
jgi:phage shock protein A